MTNIKKSRVQQKAGSGPYHQTFEAIWKAIPQEVKDRLPSRLLVQLTNAMEEQHKHGSYHRAKQIEQEGLLYVAGGFRELGPLVRYEDSPNRKASM